jgi:predicted ATPase
MMMQLGDPRNAPEMLTLRESIRAWRFYDHFRTDADAPARSPQIGTYTPVLGDDGSDIATAIETIGNSVTAKHSTQPWTTHFQGAISQLKRTRDV